jgi:hypothetical protein
VRLLGHRRGGRSCLMCLPVMRHFIARWARGVTDKNDEREETQACHVSTLSCGVIALSALGPLVPGSCARYRVGTRFVAAVFGTVDVAVVAVRADADQRVATPTGKKPVDDRP